MSPASRPAKAARILLIAALVLAVASAYRPESRSRRRAIPEIPRTSPAPKLPLGSKIYDIKGRLITEFFSDEKREIVSIKDLPPCLINAVITREDQHFFQHHGFDLPASSAQRSACSRTPTEAAARL